MALEPSFDIAMDDEIEPASRLLVGFADIGAVSLTALDYLVDQLETEQVGTLVTRNLPDITPISNGVPRHPVRVFTDTAADLTMLISEAFMPVVVADPLVDTLMEWANRSEIDEITAFYSAPFPHGEQEHVLFHAGTDEFRDRHFAGNGRSDIPPLPGGVLDGVIGEVLSRGLDQETPPVGVLVTPSHPPGPDFEAAERLVNGAELLYGVDVDERELRRRSQEVRRYYEELVQRLQALREGGQPIGSRDFPEDRMYM